MTRTYKTAEVSGMTDIPIKTIQTYVTVFHDHFSETARQPKKGRRFTDTDIQALLTIRRGRAKGIPDDEIRQILTNPEAFPLEQEYKAVDVMEMTAKALEIASNTEDTLKAIKKQAEGMQLIFNAQRGMVYELTGRIERLERISKFEPRPAQPPKVEIKENPLDTKPKKPSLLQRLEAWADSPDEEEN